LPSAALGLRKPSNARGSQRLYARFVPLHFKDLQQMCQPGKVPHLTTVDTWARRNGIAYKYDAKGGIWTTLDANQRRPWPATPGPARGVSRGHHLACRPQVPRLRLQCPARETIGHGLILRNHFTEMAIKSLFVIISV